MTEAEIMVVACWLSAPFLLATVAVAIYIYARRHK